MTPHELVAKWRDEAAKLTAKKRPHSVDVCGASLIEGCADELASTMKVITCETCVHVSAHSFWATSWECRLIGSVPMEVNGHQFSCSAWAASRPLEETK